jgi:5-(carboxyamino)imidazole ribonucleotide synthase
MSHAKRLGILGGGQLGRMSAMSAARLGIRTYIYAPGVDCPAAQVAHTHFDSAYDDRNSLRAFADSVDVITYEFENIPIETLRFLQKYRHVYPDETLLETAQNRINEKQYFDALNIPVTPWVEINNAQDVDNFMKAHNIDRAIIKTARFGYDGKGQTDVDSSRNIKQAVSELGDGPKVVEKPVDLAAEISIITARDKLGQIVQYDPPLNRHSDHILSRSIVPCGLDSHIQDQARDMARRLAEAVDLVGVFGLEFFVTGDGTVLANEVAPRPHNSGHWSIDACSASQFEQHVRTVCGLPVAPVWRHSDAVMDNLIGDDIRDLEPYIQQKSTCLHIYGKGQARPGRKMGHVTYLHTRRDETRQ